MDQQTQTTEEQEIESTPNNPWGSYDYGMAFQEGPSPEINLHEMAAEEQTSQPDHSEIVSGLGESVLGNTVELEKSKEILDARFEISINKVGILNILKDDPEIAPIELERERFEDLQATIEAIGNLPEHLHFEPGLTLIVGENGLGKSTLNQALHLAREVKARYDAMYREDLVDGTRVSYHDFKESRLSIKGYTKRTYGGMDVKFSPLAFAIAKHIDVEQQTNRSREYMDVSVLRGAAVGDKMPDYRSEREAYFGDSDLQRNRSHGQLTREFFDYIGQHRAEYEEEAQNRREGKKPSHTETRRLFTLLMNQRVAKAQRTTVYLNNVLWVLSRKVRLLLLQQTQKRCILIQQ